MKAAALIVPLLAALFGCHRESNVEAKNATVAEIANRVAEVSSSDPRAIRPGLWSATVTIEQIDMPSVPADVVRGMKTASGTGKTRQSCLTEKDAKAPQAGFFAGDSHQCKYDHFNMGGGKIDATLRCTLSGASQVMQMNGTYSPDNYQMRMSTHMEGVGPVGGLTMAMRIDSTRIGQCPGKAS